MKKAALQVSSESEDEGKKDHDSEPEEGKNKMVASQRSLPHLRSFIIKGLFLFCKTHIVVFAYYYTVYRVINKNASDIALIFLYSEIETLAFSGHFTEEG